VPKLIAAALIAKDPVRYGFDSVAVLEPLVFDEILVTDATGLDVLADLADTTARAMIELNPHFYREVTPPGREVVVRVPRGRGASVARRWAELPESARVRFVDHRIARGETLSLIGRRYGVSVSLLLATNPGVEPRRLRVGQRLIIPVGGVARGAPSRAAAAVAVSWHTVRPGESLWKLSQRYRVSVDDLRRWNGIAASDVLRSGQRVRVAEPGDDALR
jgi:membrane-bound lytic murein transglycosylase D